MPRLRPFLLAAVLPFVLHQNVAAQNPTPPRKRLNVINQGMTPAQVRAVLGEPARVRTEEGEDISSWTGLWGRAGGVLVLLVGLVIAVLALAS